MKEMKVDVMEKSQFNVDQVVPASVASRRFGEVRRNAKKSLNLYLKIIGLIQLYKVMRITKKCTWN